VAETDLAAAARTAKAVSDVVGDGCVVRLFDPVSGGLRAAAVAHRERERRQLLGQLLDGPPEPLDSGWAADAYRQNVSFRLRHAAASDAAGRSWVVTDVRAAVAAPLRIQGRCAGVVIALRDSSDFEYTPKEQRVVDELAAGVETAALGGTAAAPGQAADAARVLESSAGAVWVTDLDDVTTYVNHAACDLVGAPSSQLIGVAVREFLEEPEAVVPVVAGTDQGDELLRTMDGEPVWVSVQATPLIDSAGRRVGTVRTLTDVGERRRLEVNARLSVATYKTIAELAELALTGGDFASLADEVVAVTGDLLGAEYVVLGEVDAARGCCAPLAVRGWPPEILKQAFDLPELAPARLCLGETAPVVIRDYGTLFRLDIGEAMARACVRSGVYCSVAGGGGVLAAHSTRVGAFSDQDLSFLGLLTSVVSARWEPGLLARTAIAG
jgi:PAS domain S-box-containing protein